MSMEAQNIEIILETNCIIDDFFQKRVPGQGTVIHVCVIRCLVVYVFMKKHKKGFDELSIKLTSDKTSGNNIPFVIEFVRRGRCESLLGNDNCVCLYGCMNGDENFYYQFDPGSLLVNRVLRYSRGEEVYKDCVKIAANVLNEANPDLLLNCSERNIVELFQGDDDICKFLCACEFRKYKQAEGQFDAELQLIDSLWYICEKRGNRQQLIKIEFSDYIKKIIGMLKISRAVVVAMMHVI